MANLDDLTPDIAPVLKTKTGLSYEAFLKMPETSRRRILKLLTAYLDDLGARNLSTNFMEPLQVAVYEERFDPLALHLLASPSSRVTTHLKGSPSIEFTRDVTLSVLKTILVEYDAPIDWDSECSATVHIEEITLPNTECTLSAQGAFTFVSLTRKRKVVHEFRINLVRSDHPTDPSWIVSRPE
jgi:hypothetical protein